VTDRPAFDLDAVLIGAVALAFSIAVSMVIGSAGEVLTAAVRGEA